MNKIKPVFIIQKLFLWVKHNEASLLQNILFCFLNYITWIQKQAWVEKNFLINSVHLYSIVWKQIILIFIWIK